MVHYIRLNKPQGAWNTEIIKPNGRKDLGNNITVGIHVHVYYPELVDQIFNAITLNTIKTELIISTHSKSIKKIVEEKILKYNLEAKDIVVTPNKGRDSPLFNRYRQRNGRKI